MAERKHGEVSERFKVQSWKDCSGDEPDGGSNPPLSATFWLLKSLWFPPGNLGFGRGLYGK